MKDYIFGAAYYPEYLPEDRIEKDLTLMEDAKINTIRIAESTWSVEEPAEGVFDFSFVTETIEAAARHGIQVIVGTPTYAVPKWLADKDPGVLGGNGFGPRQNMDITNPTYRKYAERIIREMLSRTAGYENVIGFQIDNETKHYYVHNERVLTGFREWLRARFGTVEAVNAAYGLNHWSNSVSSFASLPDPTTSVNGGYACAYDEYRRSLAAGFLAWQSKIVSEYKRDDQFITHNFDYEWIPLGTARQQLGRSWGIQPDQNVYEASKAVTLQGTDIYFPAADSFSGIEIAFGGDLSRTLKDRPYLVLESQAEAFTGWLPYPGQLRQMALSHFASGALGLMYWPWNSIHSGMESYWKGVLDHDGEPGVTYREISALGNELQKLVPVINAHRGAAGESQPPVPSAAGHNEAGKCAGTESDKNASGKANRIALVVSHEALTAMRWFPQDTHTVYNDVVMAYYRALYEQNLECDVLYDRALTGEFGASMVSGSGGATDGAASYGTCGKSPDLRSRYDMLVFPLLYCANDALIDTVRRFVSEGGTVVAGCRSFFADENLQIRHDRQPHGLTGVFGMHYARFTSAEGIPWMELLVSDGAEVISSYEDRHWSGYAAITHNEYREGRTSGTPGHAWYIGYTAAQDVLKRVMKDAAETAGLDVPEIRWPLIRRKLGDLVFVFNYSDEDQTIHCREDAADILTGNVFRSGEKTHIPAWGALCLQKTCIRSAE